MDTVVHYTGGSVWEVCFLQWRIANNHFLPLCQILSLRRDYFLLRLPKGWGPCWKPSVSPRVVFEVYFWVIHHCSLQLHFLVLHTIPLIASAFRVTNAPIYPTWSNTALMPKTITLTTQLFTMFVSRSQWSFKLNLPALIMPGDSNLAVGITVREWKQFF